MRAWASVAASAAILAVFCGEARASTPVVVEYVAPPECASSEAFHALLSAQLAQNGLGVENRPWRFSVTIRHESDYVGVLQTESGTRELRAPTCDEVTAALSLVIAMAQPELPAPPPPQVEEAAPPPSPMIPPLAFAPPPVRRDVVTAPQRENPLTWRLGARVEHWDDGSTIGFNGGFLTLGLEVPWGLPKMHFEVGVGALYFKERGMINWFGNGVPPTTDVLLGLIDVQACPIDLPLWHTGIDVMGCARITGGLTKGILANGDYGAGGWGGGGARVRWQSPWHVFVEAHGDGLYGTKIEGVPALMDFGGSVGFRI